MNSNKELVIGTTVPPFKAVDNEDVQWLEGAEQIAQHAFGIGFSKVTFFVAIELDARGPGLFTPLIHLMNELEKAVSGVECVQWKFAIDDGADVIGASNRLVRICTGRNLIHEYAMRSDNVTHILFVDSDLIIPTDSVPKLLEMNYPIAGGDVPSYCLGGPVREEYSFPVQEHWNTAGFLLVSRDVFRKVRWRHDIYDQGATDDPCFALDVVEAGFGPTHVRKDLIGIHKPLKPLEGRGHDLAIHR